MCNKWGCEAAVVEFYQGDTMFCETHQIRKTTPCVPYDPLKPFIEELVPKMKEEFLNRLGRKILIHKRMATASKKIENEDKKKRLDVNRKPHSLYWEKRLESLERQLSAITEETAMKLAIEYVLREDVQSQPNVLFNGSITQWCVYRRELTPFEKYESAVKSLNA